MKYLFLIIIVTLLSCSKQPAEVVKQSTKQECECVENYTIAYRYEGKELQGVCYVPYYFTSRSGLDRFYEIEVTDCKGGGIVRIMDKEGRIVRTNTYLSTDSTRLHIETYKMEGIIDTVETLYFYPELIEKEIE